jgi:hypothetical protein
MTEAIFGLVGVVIGALIGSVTTVFIEKRKERLAARVAARLVRDELYIVAVWLEDLLSFEHISEEQFERIKSRTTTDSWAEQRVHLAAVMSYENFADASMAVGAADRFRHWISTQSAAAGLDDKARAFLKNVLENLRPGLEALKAVAK